MHEVIVFNGENMKYKLAISSFGILFFFTLIYVNSPYLIDVYMALGSAIALGVYYFFFKK
ncbi:hypothetical protein SOPP22_14985 [Shewanella sp. OPT22]|nr:hypothetical protein SOPP22_14985 [Shewanella sp. OPT22]